MRLRSVLLIFIITFSAHAESVSKSKTWHRLLHFNEKTGHSEIADSTFFYSPHGMKDPEAELSATIDHIKNESPSTPEAERFSCRFPARKRFIEKELHISPHLDCPTFKELSERYQPDSVYLVFASHYASNPSSAMGHTFLRFDQGTRSKLLGKSLSYFAQSNIDDNAFIYSLKGLFGAYLGMFEFDDYYPKAHLYGGIENRDLWEYKLLLSKEEELFIFEHAYELALSGKKKYFFLDRNCAFQLLALLEVATEDLNLTTDGDRLFLSPQDSIKILASNNLIGDVSFRPSLSQKANAYYRSLDHQQKEAVSKILAGHIELEEMSDEKVLSTLIAILAIKESSGDSTPSEHALFESSTNARAKLPTNTSVLSQLNEDNKNKNPLHTQGTHQFHLGFTKKDKNSAAEIGFRPAVHSLDDLQIGFPQNSQLIFAETVFRIQKNESQYKVELHQIDLIDIKSLPSYSFIDNKFSWAFQLAYVPTIFNECIDCHTFRSNFTLGYSKDLASHLFGFLLAGPTLDISKPESRLKLRAGPSLLTGLISRVSDKINFRLENRFDYFYTGLRDREILLSTELASTWWLKKNSGLSLSFTNIQNLQKSERNSQDTSLSYLQHF